MQMATRISQLSLSSSHLTSKIVFTLLPSHFTSPSKISPFRIPLLVANSTFVQLISSPSGSPMLPLPVHGNGSGRPLQSQESRLSSGSPVMIVSQPKPTFLNSTSSPKQLALSDPQKLKPHSMFFVTAPLSNPSGISLQNRTFHLISLISTSSTGSRLYLPQHPTLCSFPRSHGTTPFLSPCGPFGQLGTNLSWRSNFL
nr:hypothetical protein CFP56_48618 [Quercus suber]